MQLSFEGKQKVRYAFGDQNIINSIGEFTKIMNKIADNRNKRFINKTKEEISEIQDAVELINELFNYDFEFIKKEFFRACGDLVLHIRNPIQ